MKYSNGMLIQFGSSTATYQGSREALGISVGLPVAFSDANYYVVVTRDCVSNIATYFGAVSSVTPQYENAFIAYFHKSGASYTNSNTLKFYWHAAGLWK